MTDDPIARMKQDFIADASDNVDIALQTLATLTPENGPSRSQVDGLFRTVHSLKGTSGMFDLHEVSVLAGSVEDLLDLVRSARLNVDGTVLGLMVEAFDELAVLLQQACRGGIPSSGSQVRLSLDRLVRSVSAGTPGEESVGRDGLPLGLPGHLEGGLSAGELAALRKHVERGDRVCTMTFEFDADAPLKSKEMVLRRLQEGGEIVSVLPPDSSTPGSGKGQLCLVYATSGGDLDIDGLGTAFGLTVKDIAPHRYSEDTASHSVPSGASYPEQEVPCNRFPQPAAPLSVKVDITVLDSMMNTVSELCSLRQGLLGVARSLPHTDETRRLRDDLLKLGLILNNRASSLGESIVAARLVPVSHLFERYRGEVRRLARRSGKKVGLGFEGMATRIDRAMLDSLHDPLLHIIRNAVDHGIEKPAERVAAGKPEKGLVLLRARQEAGHICIEIKDDGRGVDLAKVRREALDKGIPFASTTPPLNLIFEPGISTRRDVSDISGRGVGLDAAKTKIDSMKGMITVDSVPAQGTCFCVYVPLTLAISRGVLVDEDGLPAIVPLRSVIQILALKKDAIREMKQSGTLVYRGSRIKALLLSRMLKVIDRREARSAVILGVGGKRRALAAWKVKGEAEIVCRPLPEAMTVPNFIAGATELFDGRPAVVIQPEDLLREDPIETGIESAVSRRLPDRAEDGDWGGENFLRLLIFRTGHKTYGVRLNLLKEVIQLRSLSEIPVLGDAWQGIFFHRGMCHGLLRLSDSKTAACDIHSVAILASPERCGVGMGEVCGHFDFRVSDIMETPDDGRSGLLRPCGKLTWEGREVTIIGGTAKPHALAGESLSTTGRKG